MRFLLHLAAAALLMAIGIGGMTSARAADRDARAAVAGRQKIREELSLALEKGYLTRLDQYHILLHAKEVLNESDLHGLERTLDRIARRQSIARSTAIVAPSDVQTPESVNGNRPEVVTPSDYEEPKTTEVPSVGEPTAKNAQGSGGSPFVEEVPTGIGKPAIHLDGEEPESCGCDPEECQVHRRWIDFDLFAAVDSFKGPLDIGNANGNFGTRLGVNASVPILPRLGIGFQAGMAAVLSNLKGSPYPQPNSTIRDQIFTTVGMFQRLNREQGAFTWGFVYDWLFDDYYANFRFGQWRVKAAWECDPCDEIGILTALPEHGSSGSIPDPFTGLPDTLSFKPITQGFLYWKHTFCNDASVTGRLGMAEKPGEFVFGGEGRVPVTTNMAMTGNFNYIMPNAAGGPIGQTQEIWNLSVGVEFVLGGRGRGCSAACQPFLPVADNGSFAVRETQ